jgi:hypothetical protein
LIKADRAIAALRPDCLFDKPETSSLKRKRNDSANLLHQGAENVAGGGGEDGLTQDTYSERLRRIKRVRSDSAITTNAYAETSSGRTKESPQRRAPVAVMVAPSDDIQNCTQDEWYGRLTPHGEDKRHELFCRYRERHSVESDSQSTV